jgi:aminoglycoside phosphotransferase (APT) family kinase protein
MAQLWDADVELDEDIVRRMIEAQFPVLAPARLASLGKGWDNLAFRVNDDFVFRIPHRKMGADLIETEARFLPQLAPKLPVEIPVPQFFGQPAGNYPYRFLGYRHIAGTTGCSRQPQAESFDRLAEDIARFLSTLHALSLGPEMDAAAPGDEIGRTNFSKRITLILERFDALREALPHVEPVRLRSFVNELGATPAWTEAPRWVHGDLYARHLVLDGDDRLCGVIDWGDVHRSDPALDLSVAWSYLPARSREIFRTRYGDIDEDTWQRSRFVALHYAFALILYGLDVGDRPLEAVGRRALEYVLEGTGVTTG